MKYYNHQKNTSGSRSG